MIFVSYEENESVKIGVICQDKVYDLEDIFRRSFKDMTDFIKFFDEDKTEYITERIVKCQGVAADEVKLLAPIPEPEHSIICLGKNYREHVKEVKSLSVDVGDAPDYPIYFEKRVDRALGSGESINLNAEATAALDYEAELGIIIGKEGKNIKPEDAEKYIFGYTIINDVTARDIQKKHIQWFRGKSLDGTCPIGPWIVHKRSIAFPPELKVESRVNGELRQNGNTKELIFDVPYIISDFSKGITLKPGDIISTGTPAGVGMGFDPPKYLIAGDEIDCYIEGIGHLVNKVE